MYHTIAHLREAIQEKNYRAKVTDVTHELGVLSIQGRPKMCKLVIIAKLLFLVTRPEESRHIIANQQL